MSEIPRISDAEWTVMKILWENSPLTGKAVYERLKNTTNWKLKTLKTLLNRLVSKKAIGYTQEGRIYHYFPLLSCGECLKRENQSFLQKCYQGSVRKMLTGFALNENLSLEDLEELKKILEEREVK